MRLHVVSHRHIKNDQYKVASVIVSPDGLFFTHSTSWDAAHHRQLRALIDKPVLITYGTVHSVGRLFAPIDSLYELNALLKRPDLGEDLLYDRLLAWKETPHAIRLRNKARSLTADDYNEPTSKRPAEQDVVDLTNDHNAPVPGLKVPRGISFRATEGASSATAIDLSHLGF